MRLAQASTEHPVALLVDDLLALGDGKGGGVVLARGGRGADEAVLFDAVGRVLLDHARGLILAAVEIRRRADAVALVFDRRHRLVGRAAAAGEACERGFDLCKHWPRPLVEPRLPQAWQVGEAWRPPLHWVSPRSAFAAAIPSMATTRRSIVLRP